MFKKTEFDESVKSCGHHSYSCDLLDNGTILYAFYGARQEKNQKWKSSYQKHTEQLLNVRVKQG